MAFKKFWVMVIFAVMFLLSENVSAMTFSQPVEIGYIGHYFQSPYEGMPISGESYNSGKIYPEREGIGNGGTYVVGIARFGNGSNALYCSYDCNDDYLKFGGQNNYVVSLGRGAKKIYRIDSDEGLTLYVIDTFRFGGIDIIGRQKNGKWFSYVDSDVLTDKYFNGKMAYQWIGGVLYGRVHVAGDTVTIPYSYQLDGGEMIEEGELRFKWDDAAQGFSIEKVVY